MTTTKLLRIIPVVLATIALCALSGIFLEHLWQQFLAGGVIGFFSGKLVAYMAR